MLSWDGDALIIWFKRLEKGTFSYTWGSTIQMDRILVFKNGYLVETGSHETLYSAKQEYASLFQMQANLYNP